MTASLVIAVRDDFDRDGVLLMRLQIFDQIDGVLL